MATVEAYETTAGRRYMVRYRTPERKQTKKRGFKTKRSAEAFASSLEVSMLRGEFIDPAAARSTVLELGGAWLQRQTHLKPSTARAIESSWRLHVTPRWGSVPVAEIRRTAVQAWVSELSAAYSPTTVARAHGALASLLDDAVDDRRILTNPARGVNLPRKVRREHTYLDHQQVAALATAAGRHETLVLVFAYCGLRWGEAAGLRVRDLDMLRHRLRVNQNAVEVGSDIVIGTPKTHERRSVPFPAFLSMRLAAACEGKGRDDVVFHGDRGDYLKRSKSGTGWFWRAARDAGIDDHLTPHDLRHTAASLAVSAGANVKAVQRMLGHASASMTLDVYADLFDNDLDGVAVALESARLRAVSPG
ncbi:MULTISPECIES: tyrosine-type recombinase/integrase [Oerskovia]|uniref:Site-specific integrase n=1 Tax=Oerskovia merdavium TaxID=2762227 RepID=A0ABR8TXS5_9CELL|nr:tyrosine-type recombinase/integrase [Oerskovia merdavium]MBD7980567.1 site-specific integrase [Oerskovia merdavium]